MTLRKAHAEFPISAVQSEYSLWTRNPEIAVLQACAELGVALVAFSPVGRGFLTSAPPDIATFDVTDFRKNMPRFAPETYATNCKLLAPFTKVAQEAGCTPAQLAIAWLLHKAPHIVPIPGTTSVAHALENAAAVDKVLSAQTLADCEALINSQTVQGNRYPLQARSEVDTEEVPGT